MPMPGVLYDARGNEIRGGWPDGVNNETITDARPATNNFTAAAQEILLDLNGAAVVSVDLRSAACVLTVVFEGTIDGTNYFALPAFAMQQALGATLTSEQYVTSVTGATTVAGSYYIGVTGYRRFRLRCSAWTSGSITCAVRCTNADAIIYARPIPCTLVVEIDGSANATATITLPAAGAGMFHYIVGMTWHRHCTAALVGTGAFNITTTNLPGAMKWRVGNAIAVGAHMRDVEWFPHNPVKSSVANTNTTIVAAAAGAAVLCTGTCQYYVGF